MRLHRLPDATRTAETTPSLHFALSWLAVCHCQETGNSDDSQARAAETASSVLVVYYALVPRKSVQVRGLYRRPRSATVIAALRGFSQQPTLQQPP